MVKTTILLLLEQLEIDMYNQSNQIGLANASI